jgi:hypothetical protein
VTIADRDVPASSKVHWLLAMELLLLVPSMIGKLYKGNQHRHGEDKHFSTMRQANVLKEKVAAGESGIRVAAHLGDFRNTAEFAVATSGSADRSDLEFAITEESARPCEEGGK